MQHVSLQRAQVAQHSALRRLFAFDLDGTITEQELLPLIARLAGLEAELSELTRLTLSGDIDFEASFRRRFSMLRHIPLSSVHACVSSVRLDSHIHAFIRSRPEECIVVTGNLDLWIQPLLEQLGCRYYASRGAMTKHGLTLLSVLDKGAVAQCLRREGHNIIAIGESVNDVPLFRAASMGIAFAGVHSPVPEIRCLASFSVRDGAALCTLLETL